MPIAFGDNLTGMVVARIGIYNSRMRRTLALGCCALSLAFCFAAGTAHVHEAAENHDHHHGPTSTHDHGRGLAQDHHHHGVYPGSAVVPATGAKPRPGSAILTPASTIERSSALSHRVEVQAWEIPDPPGRHATRLRAPPV